MKIYDGKVIIITGAASGIGKALAQKLARFGAIVVMTDVNSGPMEETAGALTKEGLKTKAVTLDVSDRDGVSKLVEDTAAEHGRLDYLFNNAGIGVGGEARDFSYDDWKKVLDVNLYGTLNGTFAAYPIMVKRGSGHIINTASLAGLIPFPAEISYTTSKYAIVGMSHALRAEGAALGVNVTVVCPGKIETSIYRTSKFVGLDREKALAFLPKGVTAEECADVILKGVARNKATIVVTFLAKLMWILHRISPGLINWVAKIYMKKVRSMKIEN